MKQELDLSQQKSQSISRETAVVAIAHRVKPGYEAEFEAAVRGVTLAASTFPGYLGSEVLYPQTRRGEWQVIMRFDTPAHLQEWENSPVMPQVTRLFKGWLYPTLDKRQSI